jgi:hypothetical protein
MNFAFKTSQTSDLPSERSRIQAVGGNIITAEKCDDGNCDSKIYIENNVLYIYPSLSDNVGSPQLCKKLRLSNLVTDDEALLYDPTEYDIIFNSDESTSVSTVYKYDFDNLSLLRIKNFFDDIATHIEITNKNDGTQPRVITKEGNKSMYKETTKYESPGYSDRISYYIKTKKIIVREI